MSQDKLATVSEETLSLLHEKHPPASSRLNDLPSVQQDNSLVVDEAEVRRAILGSHSDAWLLSVPVLPALLAWSLIFSPDNDNAGWACTAGGCEAAIHAARRYLESLPPDHVVAKLDFSNAFNTLHRRDMLQAIFDRLPEL